MKTIVCPCGNDVKVRPSQEGRKKYCSKKCKNDNYVRPFGIKPIYTKPNPGWFKGGDRLNESHPNWVGDDVGYHALHSWIHRKLGTACKCEECGMTEAPDGKKFFQWANLSGEYKRDTSDWRQMCCICHRKYDGITKLSKSDAANIRDRFEQGEMQKTLAKEYDVDQGTISNIVRNKIKYYAE